VRVSRELARDRDTVVGPLRIKVLEGLRRIHAVLEPNEFGVSFDIMFDSKMPPFEERTYYTRTRGRLSTHYQHYNQAGRWSGSITVAGTTWPVTPDRFWGERDRSWGVRPGVGGPDDTARPEDIAQMVQDFGLFHWMPTQFPDYSMWYLITETPKGLNTRCDGGLRFPWGNEKQEEALPVCGIEHEMEFFPGTRRYKGARICLALGDGDAKRYTARLLLPCYLQGGGYNHPTAYHGAYRGKLLVEGEKWDLTDEQTLARLQYANDNFSEWRCDDGEVGYGVFEYGIYSSERYGFSPAMPGGI